MEVDEDEDDNDDTTGEQSIHTAAKKDRKNLLRFTKALIDGLPSNWFPDKDDIRNSTDWPFIPSEEREKEDNGDDEKRWYDLNSLTADMARVICLHLYGVENSSSSEESNRNLEPYGTRESNSVVHIMGSCYSNLIPVKGKIVRRLFNFFSS